MCSLSSINRILPVFALAVAVAGLTGCDASDERAAGVTPAMAVIEASSSVSLPQARLEDEARLVAFARVLARALDDVTVREAVHAGVAERFDGAPNVLMVDMADRPLGEGTFAVRLARAHADASGSTLGQARRELAQMMRNGRLHIAVPAHFDAWDPAHQTPLVAVAARPGDDDMDVVAFDAEGNLTVLSGASAPDEPVVVVALNERIDADGRVYPQYARSRGASVATAPTGNACPETGCGGGGGGGGTSSTFRGPDHEETLEIVKVKNDHEHWTAEPAEISYAVMCAGFPTAVRDRLGDPEPEFTNLYAGLDSQGRYIYKQSTSDLAIAGIFQFTWASSFGDACAWNFWEEDGDGKETVTVSATYDTGDGTTATVSGNVSKDKSRAEMGTKIVVRTERLEQQYFSADIEWNLK